MTARTRSASTTDVDIEPRKVAFDLSETPLDWIPGETFASQLLNAAHLILPAGELAFCRVFNQALPNITDEKLAEDVRAFIRQEAMHARTHENAVVDYLEDYGIGTRTFTERMAWFFREGPLGDTPFGLPLPKSMAFEWMRFRVGMIASLEHTTCVIGEYFLNHTDHWDEMGADPALVDMLRWHGAEEVEHRCVAFDLYQHLGGGYLSRYHMKLSQTILLFVFFAIGSTMIVNQIPEYPGRKHRFYKPHGWLAWHRAGKAGVIPSMSWLLKQEMRFLSPWYHPSKEANTQDALDYLAGSAGVIRGAA